MPPFFDERGDPALSPYTVLNLPPSASDPEIKKAYRTAMLQLHPDKLSPDLSEGEIASITEKFHNVKDAYEFLTSPQYLTARRLYQAKMASQRAEYERREAFLRRAQQSGGAGSGQTVQTQRTRMTNRTAAPDPTVMSPGYAMNENNQRVAPTTSHNVSKSKPSHRFNNAATTAARTANRGYTSDAGPRHTNPRTATRTTARESRRNSTRQATRNTKMRQHEPQRTRAKSEQPRRRDKRNSRHECDSEDDRARFGNNKDVLPKRRSNKSFNEDDIPKRRGKNVSSNNNSSSNKNKREAHRTRQKQSRAKSAPPRYRTKPSTTNNSYSSNDKRIPKEFICPLTKRLLRDPVLDPDGNAYEREAIERWLRVQNSSPVTNAYLDLGMLRSGRELKGKIYKMVGKPRSKSQSRTRKTRSSSPNQSYVSGRVLVDSYLREISSKSKLSVALDGMGICAFSYRKITFVIEVPILPSAGFMVYSSFSNTNTTSSNSISRKIDAWNKWLSDIKWSSRVSHISTGNKTVFSLKGSEREMMRCEIFQKTLEYFVEMSLKLHNVLYPSEMRSVENVCLTLEPIVV